MFQANQVFLKFLPFSGGDNLVSKLTDKINTTSSHKLILAHMPLIMVCLEVLQVFYLDTELYGNFRIFLSLWFYVKSILADFRRSKTVIVPISAALNLKYLGTFDIFKWEIPKNQNLKPTKCLKWQFQSWFHVKSKLQESC